MGKELDIYKLHKPDRTYDIIDLDIVSMADQIAEENNLSYKEAVILAKIGFPSGKTKIADIVKNGFSCKVEKEASLRRKLIYELPCFEPKSVYCPRELSASLRGVYTA